MVLNPTLKSSYFDLRNVFIRFNTIMWNLELSVGISARWSEWKLSKPSWWGKLGRFHNSSKDIIFLTAFLCASSPLMMCCNEGKKEEVRASEREQRMESQLFVDILRCAWFILADSKYLDSFSSYWQNKPIIWTLMSSILPSEGIEAIND